MGNNTDCTDKTWLESWSQDNGALEMLVKCDYNEYESEQNENMDKAWLLYCQ